MKQDLRFSRYASNLEDISFTYNGEKCTAKAGDNLATAVLAAGAIATRITTIFADERAPYCMMGSCFECLMIVNGIPNCQTCMIEVKNGMIVESGFGKRKLDLEVAS
ncbi:MAG: (2Fe-2S)-binding protein [Rhizobiales bacterium]|nr:(2Fe-2S)-binding protein [Hyphomicrobiales bacterium]